MKPSDVVPLLLAEVTFPSFHPLAGENGVVRGFLIRHPDGPILVDTGVGFGHPRIDEWYQPASVRIEEALAPHGVAPNDLKLAINTHLHFDHCGQNAALGNLPIVVQSTELAVFLEPKFTITEWVSFPGANYLEVDGDSEVAPGVRVLSTPGHTPGCQSVAVATDAGLVLIAAQAIYSADEYEHIRLTRALREADPPPDPQAYLRSALRLVDLDPSLVLFSHDDAVIHR